MFSRTWKRSSKAAAIALACLGAGTALAQAKPSTHATTQGAPFTATQSIPSVGANWSIYNGDFSGRRYSTLSQINSDNVKNLSLAWAFQTKGLAIKGTPVVVDGVLYVTSPNHVWALDAITGVKLWAYERKSEGNLISNRGVAYLNGKVYFGTPDAHVIALNAKTGKLVWDHTVADVAFGYYIATSPLIVHGKLIIGTSGDVADVTHALHALDPETGKEIWHLNTIPAAGEPGADTWPSEEARKHGGGPLWVTGTYDPELNLMYWGTGNPHPVMAGDVRKGANLYTCSILAIDPDTGKMKWYFQPSQHDTRDWDAVETDVLFDATIDGKPRKLLAHASRNGYYFLLDRTTGKSIVTKQFVPTNFSKELDAKGQPIPDPAKEATAGGVLLQGEPNGATNWPPPTMSLQTGLFYLNAVEGWAYWYSALDKQGKPEDHQGGSAISLEKKPVLLAIDPMTGKEVWRRSTGLRTYGAGGLLTTAGHLLFGGDAFGNIYALDPANGHPLWHTRPAGKLTNAPITFEVDGKQYVVFGIADTLYTFTLP